MSDLIYGALAKAISEVGPVTKDRTPESGPRYKYTGIEDIIPVVREVMIKNEICLVPQVIDQSRFEFVTSNNKPMQGTVLTVKFTFFASDGSSVEAITIGESSDSGDKGSNKAMSAALKYALKQVFMLTTGDGDDTEASHPGDRVAGSSKPQQPQTRPQQKAPSMVNESDAAKAMAIAQKAGDPHGWSAMDVIRETLSEGFKPQPGLSFDETITYLTRVLERQYLEPFLVKLAEFKPKEQE